MDQTFESKLVPEWKEGYVGYYTLSAILQAINASLQKHTSLLFEHARQLPQLHAPQHQIQYVAGLCQLFRHVYQQDCEKMLCFARLRLEELKSDWVEAGKRSKECSGCKGSKYINVRSGLKLAVQMLYKNGLHLKQFIDLNITVLSQLGQQFDQKEPFFRPQNGDESLALERKRFLESQGMRRLKDELTRVLDEMESNYVSTFYHQFAKKEAVEKLTEYTQRVKPVSSKEIFVIGIFSGCLIFTVIILILGFSFGVFQFKQFEVLGPIYRGAALFICYLWGLSLNVLVWQKFHVNYTLVLKMGSHHSSFASIAKRNAFFTGLLMFIFLLHVLQESRPVSTMEEEHSTMVEYLPFVFYLIFFGYIFFPSDRMFNPKGRQYFYELLYNILFSPLPFVQVTFLVNWATDQLVSFAGPIRDLAYTICFYSSDDQHFDCNPKNYNFKILLTSYIVVLIPLFYRSAQCFKLAYLSGSFFTHIQFYNLLKYLTSVLAVTSAFIYKHNSNLLPVYIIASLVSMLFSYYWDLKHDWGFLQENSRYPFLRSRLSYKNPVFYYCLAVVNLLLRSAWIISITHNIGQLFNSEVLVFFVSLLELLRRCLWNFVRVEKEHLANCGSFRTTDDIRAILDSVQQLHESRGVDAYRIEEGWVIWIDLSFNVCSQVDQKSRWREGLQRIESNSKEVVESIEEYCKQFKKGKQHLQGYQSMLYYLDYIR